MATEPDRLRYLPVSVGLGLFVGDLLTLALRGDLTLARAAVAGLVAVVAWQVLRWAMARRPRGDTPPTRGPRA